MKKKLNQLKDQEEDLKIKPIEEEPKPPTIRQKRIIIVEWRYKENGNI
jgi:hypothetical protein